MRLLESVDDRWHLLTIAKLKVVLTLKVEGSGIVVEVVHERLYGLLGDRFQDVGAEVKVEDVCGGLEHLRSHGEQLVVLCVERMYTLYKFMLEDFCWSMLLRPADVSPVSNPNDISVLALSRNWVIVNSSHIKTCRSGFSESSPYL